MVKRLDPKVVSAEPARQIEQPPAPIWKRPAGVVIGCVAVVPMEDKFVAINCAKGRGIIMPGGKNDDGESFHRTAARELQEEAGLHAVSQRMIFNGHDCDGVHCYAFLTAVSETSLPPYKTREGMAILATWDDLLERSYYHGYYRVLKEIMERTVAFS